MHYGLNYFEHMLRKMSATAEDVCSKRWDFIKETNARTILDYGCGVGWFRAFRPPDLVVNTYDIGSYPQTGILETKYDLICFFDSLEHVPDLRILDWIWSRTNFVAVVIPIKPDYVLMEKWKHYRPPDEHANYFTLSSIHEFFHKRNFQLIKYNQCECPPREDVWSILYKRSK